MLKSEYTPKAIRAPQNIPNSAYSLFTDLGYDQATMRAIAAEAGTAAGGIYHYFPAREKKKISDSRLCGKIAQSR